MDTIDGCVAIDLSSRVIRSRSGPEENRGIPSFWTCGSLCFDYVRFFCVLHQLPQVLSLAGMLCAVGSFQFLFFLRTCVMRRSLSLSRKWMAGSDRTYGLGCIRNISFS